MLCCKPKPWWLHVNLWRGPTDRCSEDLHLGNKLSLYGMLLPNYFSYCCGERRIFLHTQEFINSALAVTSVYVCLFERSIWLCSVTLWAWISTLCLFLWLSEGSCHISVPTCRRWVLPWLQVMSSSLAPGSEVHYSCSAETSHAHCLQVFGGGSVKRVNGFEMKGLFGKLCYQCSLWVPWKGQCVSVRGWAYEWSRSGHFLAFISSFHHLPCLRAMWIHFYVPVPVKYLLYGGLEYEKVFIEKS